MPTEIYVKGTDDEGKEVYTPLEKWDDVVIPDEVVRTTKAYKDTLTESVNRRNTIKTLREQLTKLETEDGEPNPQPTPTPEPTDTGLNFKSRQEMIDFILAETTQRDTASAQAKRDKEAKITELVNKHQLGSDAIPVLMQLELAQAEVTAQYIGQTKLRFDSTKGGAGEHRQISVDSIAAKVAGKLNLTEEK